MIAPWTKGVGRFLALTALLASVPTAVGQQATSSGSSGSTEGITLAASGLTPPRGFAWAPDDTFFVAQAGAGRPASATPQANDQLVGGLDGSVVRIDGGCPVVYQGSLPSAGGTGGYDLGPSGLAVINGQLYVADEGGGAIHGNPLTPDGIYRLDGDGSARVVADIGTWIGDNPVAELPEQLDPDGNLTGMIVRNGSLLVVESNGGQILRVTPQGEVTRMADLSQGSLNPMGIAVGQDGTMYVGMATATPEDGASKIVAIAADGSVEDVWTGLTAVVDVAVGSDGTLYALELGIPDADAPLGVAPNSGRVLRQIGPGEGQDVAVGIDRPATMAFGPDQGLYVSTPAVATGGQTGAVIRLNLQQGQVMTMSPDVLAASPCVAPSPASTPAPTASAPASASPEATPEQTAEASSGIAVSIENFSFGSGPLTVAVGTTVTWTNNDVVPHTVTARDGSFNSGNLNPGETFSFTFSVAGTFDYICSYHPNMMGAVVVS